MKIFLLFMGLIAKEAIGQKSGKTTVNTKAASTYENCNCQCDSTKWTDGNRIYGNCLSQDKNGALFCYVSGEALCACRDVQCSKTLPNKKGNFQHFSYEACATKPRNQCYKDFYDNYGYGYQQNLGDGDNLPYCSKNSYNQQRCPRTSVYSPPTRKPNYGGGGSSTNGGGQTGGSSNYGGGGISPRKKSCVFPFKFNGKTYNRCTTNGNKSGNTKAWCSTKVDSSGKHIGGGQGNWKNCW